jgi:hypothetical protein
LIAHNSKETGEIFRREKALVESGIYSLLKRNFSREAYNLSLLPMHQFISREIFCISPKKAPVESGLYER